MISVLVAIFGVSGTIVTAFFTYKLGLRNSQISELKSKQEAKKDELENVEGGIRMWREMSERLEGKLLKCEAINDLHAELKVQYTNILAQNKTLLSKIAHLEAQLTKLTKQ